MKYSTRLLLALLGIAISTAAFSQGMGLHTGVPIYHYNNKIAIGIGNTNPLSTLHITSTASNALRFSRTNANVFGYEIGGTTFGLYDYTNAEYKWRTTAGNVLLVENSGKVGIGTASPEAKLHLDGGALQVGKYTQNGMIYLGGNKGYSFIGSTRSDGAMILGKNVYARYDNATYNGKALAGVNSSAGFSGIKLGLNGQIDFFGKSGNVTADEEANHDSNIKMRLSTDGRLGIATTITKSTLTIGSGIDNNVETTGITLGTDQRNVEFIHSTWSDGFGSKLYNVDEGGGITSLRVATRGNTSQWTDAFYIEASNKVTNGNIGIGNIDPSEKLEVTGNALIDGEIYTEKIEVSVNPGNWPDYVFAPGYDLKPLGEVEAFIKANKHLPEVPSAKEVEEKGLDLGSMDATLLKKMEEMTLYLIEMKKEIETLKKENQELKRAIKK